MSLVNISALREIAMVEYADIVVGVLLPGPNEVRIFLDHAASGPVHRRVQTLSNTRR